MASKRANVPYRVELTKHPFVLTVMNAMSPTFVRLSETLPSMPTDKAERKAWMAANRATLTEDEGYKRDVFYRVLNILRVLGRMDIALHLIAKAPVVKSGVITRAEAVEYHFTALTAALTSLSDCCILLAAEVFRLGLKEQDCKLDVVARNRWIPKEAASALRALDRTLNEDRSRRNRLLHRGHEADVAEVLPPDSVIDDLRTLALIAEQRVQHVDAPFLRRMWRIEMGELQPILHRSCRDATSATSAVLATMAPGFKSHGKAVVDVRRS